MKLLVEYGPDASARDGRQALCRACKTDEAMKYHRRRRAAIQRRCEMCNEVKLVAEFVLYQKECQACRSVAKRCRTCKVVKPLDRFSPTGRAFDGRDSRCKDCSAAAMRTPAMREYKRDRNKRADVKERRNAQLRRRRLTDKAFAEEQRLAAKRRHERIQTDGRTKEQFCAEERWTCYLCTGQVTRADAEVDHIVAVANGGCDHRDNLALTHRSCNRRKQAIPLERLTWVHPSALERLPVAIAALAGGQMLLNAIDAHL